jgi:hypothetical protein
MDAKISGWKFDEKWKIDIVSGYLHTEYLLITKGITLQWRSLADTAILMKWSKWASLVMGQIEVMCHLLG